VLPADPSDRLDVDRASVMTVLPRFVSVGVLTVAVDLALLASLHSLLGVRLLLATTLAYGLSLIVNYSLNHAWAFDADGDHGRRVGRYAVLVGINYALTIAMVAGLTHAGVYYLVSKVIAVAVGSVVNFFGYRFWVFV
jgi:putative flippase GtrA